MATQNDNRVAPWLRKEIMDAIEALEGAAATGRPYMIREVEKGLLETVVPLVAMKSRDADELWKLIGKARESAHQAILAKRLGELESRFGNGNSHPKRDHRNGQPAKPGQILPSGDLSPFAGTPPEDWQANLEKGRLRQLAGGEQRRRGAPVPGTRKLSASSKMT